jgi:hypothetical protein
MSIVRSINGSRGLKWLINGPNYAAIPYFSFNISFLAAAACFAAITRVSCAVHSSRVFPCRSPRISAKRLAPAFRL